MGGGRDNVGPTLAAEGPGAPHFARSGNNNNTAEGVTGDLTRRWAVGPANLRATPLLPTQFETFEA